jgi:hypothetical protein
VFVAHYEHVLADPRAYVEPLATFLELSQNEKLVRYLSLLEFNLPIL